MEMSIKLQRPMAILDLETTGLRPEQDRIVEIAILRIAPDGTETKYVKRINPLIPIPAEASALHGIRNEDVQNAPVFKAVAQEIADFLSGCDLAGFNLAGFDLRMLQKEFDRAGIRFSSAERAIVDAKQIYHSKEPRTLEAACRFYLSEGHEKAHSALDDVIATWRVLNAQLMRYQDLPRDPAGLNSLFNRFVDPDGKFEWSGPNAAFTFGKYRGRSLQEIAECDSEYLTWIADKGDFSQNTKQIVRSALKGNFPRRGDKAIAVSS